MSGRTDWVQVWGVFAVGLLAAAQFGKVSLALPEIAAAYGREPVGIAFLVSVVGVVGIVLGVVAGDLVAAFGARRVFVGAGLLGAALSLAQAAMPPLAAMGALRVAEGVSHLGLVVAGPTLMAAAANDRDRPVAMAVWATFFGLSFAALAAAMPWMLRTGGPTLLFAAHGVALAGGVLALAPRLPASRRAPLALDPVARHRAIYAAPRLAAPGLGFVFYTAMFVALLTFLPGMMGRPGLAASLPLLSIAGTIAAGFMARRIAPDLVMAAGFACTAAFTAALLAGIEAAVHPLFLTMALIPGGAFALIPHLNATTPDRGRATGCVAQMGNVGTTGGTPLFAALIAAGGMGGLGVGLILLALGGLVTVLAMRRAVARAG